MEWFVIRTRSVGADAHIGPHTALSNTAPWGVGPHVAPSNTPPPVRIRPVYCPSPLPRPIQTKKNVHGGSSKPPWTFF